MKHPDWGCAAVQAALIPYHLAHLDAAAGDAIDAHLLGCGACLRSYLKTKRTLEERTGVDPEARPSAAARARLFAAVRDNFRPSRRTRFLGLLRRPVPLYQGVFAMAAALLFMLLVPPIWRADREADVLTPGWPAPRARYPHVDRAHLTPRDVRTY